MSREILFRAKRINNGEWVEGYYCKRKTGYYDDFGFQEEYKDCIIKELSDGGIVWCNIKPDTICQYTGLTDKNGKRIWENDICIVRGCELDEDDGYFVLKWSEDFCEFELDGRDEFIDFNRIYGYECEVVGNIFDTPELIEEDED